MQTFYVENKRGGVVAIVYIAAFVLLAGSRLKREKG